MAHRLVTTAVVGGAFVLLSHGAAWAQGGGGGNGGGPQRPVQGVGTPGTVPVWTGTTTLGDSHIQSGAAVTISAPLQVSGTATLDGGGGNIAVAGSQGTGLSGSGTQRGLTGTGPTGVYGSGNNAGVHGESSS